jgi:hypothetical protein
MFPYLSVCLWQHRDLRIDIKKRGIVDLHKDFVETFWCGFGLFWGPLSLGA